MRRSDRISRLTTTLAMLLSLAITVVVPAGYFAVSYHYMQGTLDAEAATGAAAVSALVNSNPSMWQFEQIRLSELLDRRPHNRTPEQRRVVDVTDNPVAESSDFLQKPILTGTHEIYDAGTSVGKILVSRSLAPLLWKTSSVAVAALAAGLLFYTVLRILPLRAVRRAYHSLEESEKKYRSLYESMKEGVALHRIDYDEYGVPVSFTIVDVNPSCQLLLGLSSEELIGKDGSELFGGAVAGYFPEILRAASTGEAFSFDFIQQADKQRIHVAVFFPETGYFAFLMEDVTQRKVNEEQIRRLAYYDNLTGLPNRALLMDRLEQMLTKARRDKTRVVLLFLDLDRFKVINDTMGHAHGDQLLVQVANRLRQALRSSDTLARIGGDEFVVLFTLEGPQLNVSPLAQHLIDSITSVYPISGRDVYASTSIGIATFPDDGGDGNSLLRCADMAMYAAKEGGGKGYHFYSPEMNLKAHARMELETSLRHALEREEFFLEFQPIVNARDGRLVGAEALLRWNDPAKGLIMPDMFIQVAEESGFIIPLGEWVLRTACRKMKEWREAGLPPFRISVNVSGRQFCQANFTDTVCSIIRETGMDPSFLALEMTETSLMVDVEATAKILMQLKELDISIVIDDFGAGYSSLGYLQKFPIDRIKIDRSFIRDLSSHANDKAIVEAIIAMAARLNLQVVAEGVETSEQLDFLKEQGCHEIQGFYFHRPLSEELFKTLLWEIKDHPVPLFASPEGETVVISLATC
ncbi:putative bifunctional diguanylate cyclase/phosphodiesterase [Geotalea toluenoxydans]|uniref:putative bifunctional diguanylate cyclase/phosphodiesterase n=1 Tax=Geotalea toluenoxydans TaxID=421624 RepID=UPI0006D082EA|nr:EAL domain-containing protein [Geotalea toluenoxydans]